MDPGIVSDVLTYRLGRAAAIVVLGLGAAAALVALGRSSRGAGT